MNLKTSLLAISAMCGIAIMGSPAVEAKSQEADKPKHQIVTVKSGDTLTKIADKYDMSYVRLFNANEDIGHPDVIDVGDKIRIPKKDEKLKNRHDKIVASQAQAAAVTTPTVAPTATYAAAATTAYQQPVQQQAVRQASPTAPTTSYRASSAGNTYVWGNCTWYVKNMRPDLPNMLGNGGSWTANAAAQGIATGYTPRAGAVAEIPGHVMYVERVNGNGTVDVSEMNYAGGLGQVNYRTVSTSSISSYIY